jgi:DNA-directed RNA polymerase specialized sigma24 family protein
VTDATFVEVWYRATSFDAAVRGGGEWIASIAARRCEDWLRAANLAGGRGFTDSMAYYSRHLRSELAAILMVGNLPSRSGTKPRRP